MKRSLEAVVPSHGIPLGMAMIRKQFRDAGTNRRQLTFLHHDGSPTYRLEISHLNAKGEILRHFEVEKNVDRPDLSIYKRWAHLAPFLDES